jgi:hypothetical protein
MAIRHACSDRTRVPTIDGSLATEAPVRPLIFALAVPGNVYRP